ncbi:MAG TPA: ethanolamine permease, partial [Puia sp.]|nr:ethanolamine permease [Puia sp.]
AVTLYVLGMITVLALRRKEPCLERPYRAPGYPVTPLVALVMGLSFLVALVWLNIILSVLYISILGLAYIWFVLTARGRLPEGEPAAPQKQNV